MNCYESGILIIIIICVVLFIMYNKKKNESYKISIYMLIVIGIVLLLINKFPYRADQINVPFSERFGNKEPVNMSPYKESDSEQADRSLLVPENVNGTIGTQVGINEWLDSAMDSNSQLRKSIMSLKLIGAGPVPNVTVSSDIIEPNGVSAVEVKPVIKRDMSNALENIFTENFQSGNNDVNIFLFYRPGCPWCERLMIANGPWEQFKQRVPAYVKITEINTIEKPEYTKKYHISGVPYIAKIAENSGDIIAVFEGDRTVENLLKFIN